MASRIVICANDYPHAIMSVNSTEADATFLCRKLQDNDPSNLERWADAKIRYTSYVPPPVVYYHWHEVRELEQGDG